MLSTEKLRSLPSDVMGGGGAKAASIIISLIFIAVAGYFVVQNGHHAELYIHVQSTHILADTEITVYVDGKDIGTFATGNMNGWDIAYNYPFSLFDDSKSIMVKAVSTGGYLGDQSDQKALLVKNGGTYSVTLYV